MFWSGSNYFVEHFDLIINCQKTHIEIEQNGGFIISFILMISHAILKVSILGKDNKRPNVNLFSFNYLHFVNY